MTIYTDKIIVSFFARDNDGIDYGRFELNIVLNVNCARIRSFSEVAV